MYVPYVLALTSMHFTCLSELHGSPVVNLLLCVFVYLSVQSSTMMSQWAQWSQMMLLAG